MPFVILIILILISAIGLIAAFPWLFDCYGWGDYCGVIVVMLVCVIVGGGGIIWMNCAWDQEISHEEYYRISVLKTGSMTQQVIRLQDSRTIEFLNGKFNGILADDTIIRVRYYKKYSHGINWLNGDIPNFTTIPRGNDAYEEANQKAMSFEVK